MLAAKKELFTPSGGSYQISRSVRLRASASAYLNRTPASVSNRRTWTWSGWVKRGALGSRQTMFAASLDGSNENWIAFQTTDTLLFYNFESSTQYSFETTQVFRDPSAWYHIVVALDTTQATSTNRTKIYINGLQVTSFITATYPSQNFDGRINNTVGHAIGRSSSAFPNYFDGYLTEVNFIDGQQLTPSSFGETNAITGVWQPKKYGGTYGTNGFYLNFSDNSGATATTIGKDNSGNSNNWTPNNISVTAGATYDSMLDSPTPYADGTEYGRGNYAVMNTLDKNASLPAPTSGNLNLSNAAVAWVNIRSTIAVTSGKWYAEVTQTGSNSFAGVMSGSSALTFAAFTNASGIYGFFNNGAGTTGFPYANGTSGTSFTIASGDVIGLAYDYDAQTVAIYRNNSLQATVTSVPKTEPMFFCASFAQTAATQLWNFGQRPFTYTPPTGFVALNTQNLPTPTISNGAAYMAATPYTGTGASLAITNTVNGISFQPDFVWMKKRSAVGNNVLQDSVRGVTKQLYTNSISAETSVTNDITSFNSNGFTILGTDTDTGANGVTYVGWQWNAGGSTVTNTSGSISSQVRANPTAGFSIVTYTGTGANATVGHGLGVAPKMVILKPRSIVSSWIVWHTAFAGTEYIVLESTAAKASLAAMWNSTTPTSSVFSIGTNANVNQSAATFVAYCFSEVAGYSKFGSYTGNGSADGPFVYLGFRPRLVMTKRTDAASQWYIIDTARDLYNSAANILIPNSNAAESSNTQQYDELSNGFKLRSTNVDNNASGGTYIYMAFAENPFKNSLAR